MQPIKVLKKEKKKSEDDYCAGKGEEAEVERPAASDGEGGGRGDVGRPGPPIIREYRWPRSETEMFNPRPAATFEARLALLLAIGVSGGESPC
jgi:hypothetical protein